MKQHPQKLVPQVMIMFGEYGPGGQMPTWFKFDEDALRDLFGEDLPRAVSLMSQDLIISPKAEGWFQLAGPLGTKAAREWMARPLEPGT